MLECVIKVAGLVILNEDLPPCGVIVGQIQEVTCLSAHCILFLFCNLVQRDQVGWRGSVARLLQCVGLQITVIF